MVNNKDEFYISIDCGNNGKIFNAHYDDSCISHENGELINNPAGGAKRTNGRYVVTGWGLIP